MHEVRVLKVCAEGPGSSRMHLPDETKPAEDSNKFRVAGSTLMFPLSNLLPCKLASFGVEIDLNFLIFRTIIRGENNSLPCIIGLHGTPVFAIRCMWIDRQIKGTMRWHIPNLRVQPCISLFNLNTNVRNVYHFGCYHFTFESPTQFKTSESLQLVPPWDDPLIAQNHEI